MAASATMHVAEGARSNVVTLRGYIPFDQADVAHILMRCFGYTWTEALKDQVLAKPTLVAVDSTTGTIVGMITLIRNHIHALCVVPESQRHGIGKELLLRALQSVNGSVTLHLDQAWHMYAALRGFYEKHAFVHTGTTDTGSIVMTRK